MPRPPLTLGTHGGPTPVGPSRWGGGRGSSEGGGQSRLVPNRPHKARSCVLVSPERTTVIQRKEKRTEPFVLPRMSQRLKPIIHRPRGVCITTEFLKPRATKSGSSAFHCSRSCATSCHVELTWPLRRARWLQGIVPHGASRAAESSSESLSSRIVFFRQCRARAAAEYKASRHARASAIHCAGSRAARRAAWPAHRHQVESNAASHRGTLASCITRCDHPALRLRYSCTISSPRGQTPSALRAIRNNMVRTSRSSRLLQ